MRGSGFPNAGTDPGNRRGDEIDNSAQHENFKGAVPVAERPEKHTERTIGQGEHAPGDQTRDQQISGFPEEPHHGHEREKAEYSRGCDVAFYGNSVKDRDAIGKIHPAAECRRKAGADQQADANRRVL